MLRGGLLLYIYGYHSTIYSNMCKEEAIKRINSFCKQHGYEVSEIFIDTDNDQLEYASLKEIIDSEDMLILSDVSILSKNRWRILRELKYFDNKGVRLLILNIPDTLFDIPNLSIYDNEGVKKYEEQIERSNASIINCYTFKRYKRKNSKMNYCKVKINGEEFEIKPVHISFGKVQKKNRLYINLVKRWTRRIYY